MTSVREPIEIRIAREQIAMYNEFIADWQVRLESRMAQGLLESAAMCRTNIKSYRMKVQWANERITMWEMEQRT